MTQWAAFLGLWFFFVACMIAASVVASCPLVRRWRLKRKRERQRIWRDYRQSLGDDDTFWT